VAYPESPAWPEELKQRIVKRLQEKKVRGACPMCATNQFVLLDGYFSHPVQLDLTTGMVLGGPSVPTVAIACNNCGFISQHALGALGLLPPQGPGGAK
jgi:hypothetical protein